MAIRTLSPHEAVPSVFDIVLDRFRTDAAAVFGVDVLLEPVAYELRPFSYLLRLSVTLASESKPASFCFLKIFKPKPVPDGEAQMRERVRHDFETTRHIHDALAAVPRFGAVRPLACYPEHLTIVTEEAVGQTLLAHLESRAAWFPGRSTVDELCSRMAGAGQWLRAFQAIDPSEERISLEELCAYIDLRLQRLVMARSNILTAAGRAALLFHIQRLSAAIPSRALRSVVVHADLAPGNILIQADRIVVLDFAMTSRGTCLHDLTRLFVQTDLLGAKPQFRPAVVDRLLAALLSGFDPDLTTEQPLFRLLSLLHRVNHLATLTVKRAPFPANLYNRRLRARHAAWLAREIATAP